MYDLPRKTIKVAKRTVSSSTLHKIADEIRKGYHLFAALLVAAFAGFFLGENGYLALLLIIVAAGLTWATNRETDRRVDNKIKKLREELQGKK